MSDDPDFVIDHGETVSNMVDRRQNAAALPSQEDLDEALRLLGWSESSDDLVAMLNDEEIG